MDSGFLQVSQLLNTVSHASDWAYTDVIQLVGNARTDSGLKHVSIYAAFNFAILSAF